MKNNKRKGHHAVLRTKEEIQEISDEVHFGKYNFLERASETIRKGIFYCKEHQKTFVQSFTSHFRGSTPQGCPKCYRNKRMQRKNRVYQAKPETRIPDEEIKKRCLKNFLGKLVYLYRDESNIRYGWFECCHKRKLRQLIGTNLKGAFPNGCPDCEAEARAKRPKIIKTLDIVNAESLEKYNGRYQNIGRDKQDNERGIFVCREHGVEFSQKLYHFSKGRPGCDLCTKENGGFKNDIRKIILNTVNKEDLCEGFTFKDCRKLYPLPFDFYIKRLKLAVILEYEHLSYPLGEWGGEEALRFRRENVAEREKFCTQNKINLIKISHFNKKNFGELLKNKIQEINKYGTW